MMLAALINPADLLIHCLLLEPGSQKTPDIFQELLYDYQSKWNVKINKKTKGGLM